MRRSSGSTKIIGSLHLRLFRSFFLVCLGVFLFFFLFFRITRPNVTAQTRRKLPGQRCSLSLTFPSPSAALPPAPLLFYSQVLFRHLIKPISHFVPLWSSYGPLRLK